MKGKLIVIDGIDGSGKATQTKILTARLRRAGLRVATLTYPQYDRFFGKLIGRYQRGDFGPPVHPYLASSLYAFDRFESRDRILKWLREGKIVVLDRYTSGNQIHQAARLPKRERKNFLLWLETLENQMLGLPKPDLVIYLYLPAKIAAILTAKKSARGYLGREKMDQMERDLGHQEASAKQAMHLATSRHWKIIHCIKSRQLLSIQDISNLIWKALSHKLPIS